MAYTNLCRDYIIGHMGGYADENIQMRLNGFIQICFLYCYIPCKLIIPDLTHFVSGRGPTLC